MKKTMLLGLILTVLGLPAMACELDRPVRLAGMSWMSNLMMVELERTILEQGYDCDVVVEAGDSVPMISALVRGDVDLYNELWVDSAPDAWNEASKEGKVVALGDIYSGGIEGWWIPKYVAEENPGLTSASDLSEYKDLFEDREEPGKGRIYSCPEGWVCGAVNNNLLKAFNLEDDYVMFSPGSGAALDAVIESNYRRKRPFVTYYWSPTAVLGKFEMVKLDMPEYDAEGHRCNMDSECANPYPGAYPTAKIEKTINSDFGRQAPELKAFFERINVPTEKVNELLAWADEENAEPEEVANHFLRNDETIWTDWVPSDIADKVKAAL